LQERVQKLVMDAEVLRSEKQVSDMMADRAQAMVRKAKELMEKEQSRRQEGDMRCDRVSAWQLRAGNLTTSEVPLQHKKRFSRNSDRSHLDLLCDVQVEHRNNTRTKVSEYGKLGGRTA
jgi:hypothetical protein